MRARLIGAGVSSAVLAASTLVAGGAPVALAAGPTSVAGVVTDASTGEPIAGVEVDVTIGSSLAGGATEVATSLTDASGAYTIVLAGLASAADPVTIDLVDPAGAFGASFANPVALVDDDTVFAPFALAPGGRVTGTVTGVGAGPLAGACVTVRDSATRLVAPAGLAGSCTDASGAYALPALAAGTYTLTVASPDAGVWNSIAAQQVTVAAGGIAVADASLLPVRGTAITGVVTQLGTDAPLAGMTVTATATDTSGVPQILTTATDASGAFTLAIGFQPGSQFVIDVTDPTGGHHPALGITISVQAGYTEAIGVALQSSDLLPTANLTLSGPPANIIDGSPGAAEIVVTNAGPTAAADVVVTATLPLFATAGEVQAPAGFDCTVAGQDITCSAASVGVQRQATIRIPIIAGPAPLFGFISSSVTTSSIDPNPFDNNAFQFLAVQPDRSDVRILFDARPLEVGVSAPVTLGAFNFGPAAATDVFVAARFPAGFIIDRVVSPGWSCAIDGQEVGCSLASLTTERPIEALVYVTPAEVAAGLAASAIAGTAGIATDAVDTTFDVVPAGSVDLTVFAVPVSSMPYAAGRVATLEFDVVNAGPAAATDVVLGTVVPDGLEVVSASDISGELSCAISGQDVTCTSPALRRGANARVQIAVRPGAPGGPFSVAASLTSSSVDIGSGPDSATWPDFVVIPDEADLSVSLFAPAIAVGEVGTISVMVGNLGPAPASDVDVSATVPEGFAIVSARPSFFGATCSVASRTVTCRFPVLFPTGFPFSVLQVGVIAATPATGEMSASVSSSASDPQPADNAATATLDGVAPGADLRVSVGTFGSVPVGQTGTLFVTVTNDGPSLAAGTTLVVTVPEPFRLVSAGLGGICAVTDHLATCDIGSLPPAGGTSVFLGYVAEAPGQVSVGATVSSSTPDPDPVDNETSTVLVALEPAVDLSVFAPFGASLVAGEANDVSVSVRNQSFSDTASDVVVTVGAAGADVTAIAAPGFDCSVGPDGVGRCTAAAFGPFQLAGVTVTLVPAVDATTALITATVSAATNDPFTFNNESSTAMPVWAAGTADLAAQFSLPGGSFTIGAAGDVRVGVSNFGPTSVDAATVVFTAGSAFEVLAVTADPGVDCTTQNRTVTCVTPGLAVGAAAGATVTLLPVSETSFGELMTVDVAGASIETNPFNDRQAAFVFVTRNESDLSVTLFGRPAAAVGDDTGIVVQIFNNGPAVSVDTTVEISVPPALRFVRAFSFDGCTESTPASVTCDFGTIAPFGGFGVALGFTAISEASGAAVTAIATGATPDPNDANNRSSWSLDVFPVGAVDLAAEPPMLGGLLVGQPTTIGVAVFHAGPATGPANDVRVTATFPDAVRVHAVRPSFPFEDAACTLVEQTLDCSIPSLPANAHFVIAVDITPLVAASQAPVTMDVSASNVDPVAGNNHAVGSLDIIPDESDMVLVGGSEPAPLNVGQEATSVSVFVSNQGVASTRNASVLIEAEPGLEVVSAFVVFGGFCSPIGAAWSCSVLLPPGGGTTVLYSLRATQAGSHLVTLTTTADNDVDPSNDQSSLLVDVYPEGSSDLGVTMSVTQVDDLGTTAVAVDVFPGGPAPEATDVTLHIAIPGLAATEAIDVRDAFGNPVGACASGVEEVTCSFASIGSFDRRSLAFLATPVRPVRGVEIVATVSSPSFDPNPSSNVATSGPYDLLVPPGAPTRPTGAPGDGRVLLQWGFPPLTGSFGIVDWAVEYSSDGGATWAPSDGAFSPEAPIADVTGLRNGQPYVFRVAAVNRFGRGDWSEISEPVTPSLPPRVPTDLEARAGNRQVTLTWRAPNQRGRNPIVDYVIEYSTDRGRTWNTYDDGVSTTTRTVVTGLTNGTRYTFRVAAVNAAGQSRFSEPTGGVTPRR